MRSTTNDNLEKMRKVLRKCGKDGMWIRKLSRQSGVPLGSITYYIWGQEKNGRSYGSYMLNEIEIVRIDGSNKLVRLR